MQQATYDPELPTAQISYRDVERWVTLATRGVSGAWPRTNGRTADDTHVALAGNRGLHVRELIPLEKLIITHRVTLDDAPEMYRTFREKDAACIKVVMKPGH